MPPATSPVRPTRLLRLGLLLVLLWSGLALGLDVWGRRQHPSGAWDAVVVAGCRVDPGGVPSTSLTRRTELGVRLWQEGAAPLLVFTGGLGTHPPEEAAVAAALARTLGVPEAAIRTELRSTSTEENARMAAELLPPGARIVLVTDGYHAWRARQVFRRYFSEVAVAGSTSTRSVRLRGALREVLALGWYAVRGRLSSRTAPQPIVDPAHPPADPT